MTTGTPQPHHPFMKTAAAARRALLIALQEICKGYLTATTNAERAAFVVAMQHTESALVALE